MEADWSAEIGTNLPVIAVPWEGFVDLRRSPQMASVLPETAVSPILAQWLITLNQEASLVFTSKCDTWALTANEIDPLEFDAAGEDVTEGLACYIDIIARKALLFASFPAHEIWVRSAANEMGQIKLRQARAELVIRKAIVNELDGYAVTLYVAASGVTEDAVRNIFDIALETAAMITMKLATTGE